MATKTQFDSPSKWNPRGNQLLLVPTVEEEKSEGGIFIPETVRRKACSGFIAKKGELVDPFLWIGDEVFFEQHQEFHIILDDTKEEAFLIDADRILLHSRPTPLSDVTSQPLTVNVAAFHGINTNRTGAENDTSYNARMNAQSPAGHYWNALTGDFEKHPDDPDQTALPL